jgi:putative oxidoreductase
MTTTWKAAAPHLLSVLRIFASAIFITSGTGKLFGFPAGPEGAFIAQPWTQVWIGGVFEVFGGALVLIGLLTRPVAFLLSGMMAVAFWQFHFSVDNPWPTINQGTAAILFCFLFLYLSAAGPGPWSVDAAIAKNRE